MSTWTPSAATKSGQTLHRKPALTSIDHDSQLVHVSYHEAIKIGDDYIKIGTGTYTLPASDLGTTTGQMVAASEQAIAGELAKAEPGV
jgi:hypothetical protein